MLFVRGEWRPNCFVWTVLALCLIPSGLMAETVHVVSPSELLNQAAKTSELRQQNVEKVRRFLSTPTASEALAQTHLDAQKVKNAVAQLNDQELVQLAARADRAERDFAAGYLTTRDIALIILGIAILILLIVVLR
jgi:hypothetical protein